jgi:dipeptidyl aminopeptidase/acylaminoacyl peptidase
MNRHCLTLGALIFSVSVCTEVRITADVVYGHKDGMALTYDVLTPENPNGAGVLSMISGAWYSVWRAPQQRIGSMKPLLEAGYTVFAVHHGSAPRFNVVDAVSDVRAAARHIVTHAAEYQVDADRLGVTGGSAGGHLSLMLALNPEGKEEELTGRRRWLGPRYESSADASAPLAAVVAYFPPVDMTAFISQDERSPQLKISESEAVAISPIKYVTEDDPPVLLIHGDVDRVVPIEQSEILVKAMSENNMTYDLIVLKGAGHGFRGEQGEQARSAMVAWFDKHLSPTQIE